MRHFIATFIILVVCAPFVKAQESTPVADSTAIELAEPMKFAHVDLESVVLLMPEYANAIKSLETIAAEYDKELAEMENEYSTKYDTYIDQRKRLTPQIRQRREEELVQRQQEITNFSEIARIEMAKAQHTTIAEVYHKAANMVEAIGHEYDYTYIFDSSAKNQLQLPAYLGGESVDITPLVKELLGIVVAPAATTTEE